MAQPIHCDGPGDQHPADVMLSMLANGDTLAWCMEHYIAAARMLVEMADAPTPEDQAAEATAIARLETVKPPTVEPAHVVPRGQSESRRAYEARRRAAAAAAAIDPTPSSDEAPEPSDGRVGDPDEVGDPA